MTATAPVERLEPYLRPQQVQQLVSEKNAIESMLQAPDYIRNQIQDRGSMVRQVRSIDSMLHKDTPHVYTESERDTMVAREKELREDLTAGMPTQAEMRRCPPGAIDKHRHWESAHKAKILEWKNIRVRMHASGMLDEHATASDVANLERFRPKGGSHELNMDNAIIGGKQIHLPNGPIAIRNVMSDEDREAMLARDAAIAAAAARAAIDRLVEMQTQQPTAKAESKK